MYSCGGKSGHRKYEKCENDLESSGKYHVASAVKLGNYNVGRSGQILTLPLPLYMAFLLRDY